MTSKITVDPASHTIEVVIKEGESQETWTLDENTKPEEFWIYGERTITIREITKES